MSYLSCCHAKQQTYESALQLAKENAALKEQITHLTCGVKEMMKGLAHMCVCVCVCVHLCVCRGG